MAYKVRYHEDALADLKEIFDWSSSEYNSTTDSFARDLFNHLEFLETFPYIGVAVKEEPGIRRIIHSPLIVYYRVHDERGGVEILHIRHSSRQRPLLH